MGISPNITPGQVAGMEPNIDKKYADYFGGKSIDDLTSLQSRIQGWLDQKPSSTTYIPGSVLTGGGAPNSTQTLSGSTPYSWAQNNTAAGYKIGNNTILDYLNKALALKTPTVTSGGSVPPPQLAPNPVQPNLNQPSNPVTPSIPAIPNPVAPSVPTLPTPANPSAPASPATPQLGSTNPINALPSAPVTATSPAGGITGTKDENQILAEAELQKQLSGQTLQSQADARGKYLMDLSSLLQNQQAESMKEALPGVYEDLNTRGLLRSSALGEKLSDQAKNLSAQTSSELAKTGLGYLNDYTKGLGDIENTYEGARNGAIQRGFSLKDYQRSIEASKDLGFALQPTPQAAPKSNANAQLGSAALTSAATVASK